MDVSRNGPSDVVIEKRYFNSLFHRMQLLAVQPSLGISVGAFYFWRHQIYLTLSMVGICGGQSGTWTLFSLNA
jgi:hypothetical protein